MDYASGPKLVDIDVVVSNSLTILRNLHRLVFLTWTAEVVALFIPVTRRRYDPVASLCIYACSDSPIAKDNTPCWRAPEGFRKRRIKFSEAET